MQKVFAPVAAINFLYSFIYGGLAVLVPLYLVERKASLEEIGFVFAVWPVVFLFVRMALAAIADDAGTALVFRLNGVFSFLTALAYSLASTPLGFAAGKAFEGMNSSAFWAVARTDASRPRGAKKAGDAVVLLSGIRGIADFAGRAGIGFAIAYFSFQNSLFGLLCLSALISVLAGTIGNHGKKKITGKTFGRIFERKSRDFWGTANALAVFGIGMDFAYAFLLPLYAYTVLDYSVMEVGGLLALFSLARGLGTLAERKMKPGKGMLLVLSFAFMAIPTALLGFVPQSWLWAAVALGAVGCGLGSVLFEQMILKRANGSRSVSTDIGLLHVPTRISEFAVYGTAGFTITLLGYPALFAGCALALGAFAVMAQKKLG